MQDHNVDWKMILSGQNVHKNGYYATWKSIHLVEKHSRDVTNYHVSASAECVPIASVTEQTFSIPDQNGTAL